MRLFTLSLAAFLPSASLALPRFTVPPPIDAPAPTPTLHASAVSKAFISPALNANATSWTSPVTHLPLRLPREEASKINKEVATETSSGIKSALTTTTLWSDGHPYTVTQFSKMNPLSSVGLTTTVVSGHVLTTVPVTVAKSNGTASVTGPVFTSISASVPTSSIWSSTTMAKTTKAT
ncbi:hypothetical protein F4821DRAFT_263793 [Hypoxylon rubiginosum]|uniref:Uncharacterized protein n=1 Tax=Hypoxylon rubiginosum TaxID=110542 RepID=A0ACC0CQA6_9PEZI|nr:hypothetical protein F4821DRAFT_263793 [Hypoxylon rubiginosum]